MSVYKAKFLEYKVEYKGIILKKKKNGTEYFLCLNM